LYQLSKLIRITNKLNGEISVKVLLQRVIHGSVKVDNSIVGEINNGYVIFVGVTRGDTEKDIEYLKNKIVNLRVFSDSQGKFNISAVDCKAAMLIISQFTLLADTRKGNRPSFTDAADPAIAEDLFNKFVDSMRSSGLKVETGLFQKHMIVSIENDGPVTVFLDSRQKIKND
jgi:D-aminoacyl-tRNA deacylase